jgi:hypothetical protein
MTSDTTAKLMKWPSLNGERISPTDGAAPYTIMQGSLRDCVDALRGKPASSHQLYEMHMGDGGIMSASEALALVPTRENDPPPEEDSGGGDIVSVESEPSTDDDQPLD